MPGGWPVDGRCAQVRTGSGQREEEEEKGEDEEEEEEEEEEEGEEEIGKSTRLNSSH